MATLLAFQAAGSDIGLNVWWTAEARDWVVWLRDGGSSHAANLFWKVDGRNPLLPWWYVAFRSFILGHRASFLYLHLLASLFLGLSSYLLVVSVTKGKARLFALGLGLISATFISGGRVDNVHWNITAILACSLLSVFCFSEFLNSGRTRYRFLIWSIVLWMLAVQSYSIQSGAVFSIFALSFMDQGWPKPRKYFARSITAISDVAPYVALFAMFVLFWRTVQPENVSTSTIFDFGRMIASLRHSIWNDLEFRQIIAEVGLLGFWTKTLSFLVAAIGFALLQIGLTRGEAVTGPAFGLFKVFVVAVGIVLPTLLVESSSTAYPAGSRWVFVQQYWPPTLLLLALSLVHFVLPDRVRRPFWIVATSSVAAIGFVSTLAFTSLVHNISVHEEIFMNDLRRVVIEDRQSGAAFPRSYLILDASQTWAPSDYIDIFYAESEGLRDARYRYIRPGNPGPVPLTFADDVVEHPQIMWDSKPVPYAQVGVFRWDGVKLKRIERAGPEAFTGTDATWKRSSPLP